MKTAKNVVLVHLVRDEDRQKTFCQGKPYSQPPMESHQRAYFCTKCLKKTLKGEN